MPLSHLISQTVPGGQALVSFSDAEPVTLGGSTAIGGGAGLPKQVHPTPRPARSCLAAAAPAATVLPARQGHSGQLFVFKAPKGEKIMTTFNILAQLSSPGGRRKALQLTVQLETGLHSNPEPTRLPPCA